MPHTIESIKNLLATNDKAVGRALMVLSARQTEDERSQETTKYLNGRGFRPSHARMGVSMAKYFERNGFLTEKQINYWRTPTNCGKSRIEIYSRQLLEEANLKTLQKTQQAQKLVNDEASEEHEALTNTLRGLEREYITALNEDLYEEARYIAGQMKELKLKIAENIANSNNIESDEREMMRMEAEADRAQTIRDETNKWNARKELEGLSLQQ